MPGHTRQQLAKVNCQVDMYNRFKFLMNEIYDCLLIFQPNVYIISNPEPLNAPTKIRVQVIWESKTQSRYMSYSKALMANENYRRALAEIKAICTWAFQDAQELGDSPYYDLMFGVNCLDEIPQVNLSGGGIESG